MPIQGLRTTADFTVEGERPKNWREGILMLYPNSAEAAKAPLTALTAAMKTRSVNDPEYSWFEKELDSRRLKLHATNGDLSATGGVQTLTLVDSSVEANKQFSSFKVKQGDLLLVENTNELLEVMADPTDPDKVTVRRGVAGSTPTSVDANAAGANPYLIIIGSAYEEGSKAPTGINYDPNRAFNYTQIFRNTLELTRTAMKTKLRTKEAYAEAKRECLEYTSIDMERAFFWGRRHLTTRNGKPLRMTNGINAIIPSVNVLDGGGALDMDTLDEHMYEIFRFGSSEKMVFGGNRTLFAINQAVRKNSNYDISKGEKEYGMRVTRIDSPYGSLVFKGHPLMTQAAGGTTAGTKFWGQEAQGFVLDMSNIKYVHLDGSDLDYQADLQDKDVDGKKSGYLAECGLEVGHAKTHFKLINYSAGAKDA